MDRWERLSRMLDGKRVMHRIDGILHLEEGISNRFGLEIHRADSIYNNGLVNNDPKN